MLKRYILFALSISIFSQPLLAENLIEVYKQALKSDPTFKAAEAQYLATKELAPISRAALLPSILTNGTIGRSHIINDIEGEGDDFYQNAQQYQLNINQVIFNYSAWESLKNAQAQVKAAEATYNAAAQSLMLRTSQAYFNVLQAYDILQATQAQRKSLQQQLDQTRAQFQVGLIPITGVEQVKASFDATVAQEIANQNNIADQLEQLRQITGVFYIRLTGIQTDLPLVVPRPADINAWVKIATKQNYALKSSYFSMIAARENVKVQAGGHLPTVNATGSYTYQNMDPAQFTFGAPVPVVIQTSTVGASINFPVYQGGLVNAETRQASQQYAQASAVMEQTYRSTLAQARQSYLGVASGISKIKADRQTITSNISSLAATKSSYTVGTATIVDVLQQQSFLYAARTNYSTDQYAYLINTLALKQAAGTLSAQDLAEINTWLKNPIDFSLYNFDRRMIPYASMLRADEAEEKR